MPKNVKNWPQNCVWPKPVDPETEGMTFYFDGLSPDCSNEDLNELEEIKEYYDKLVDEGILDEDYNLLDTENEFVPEKGEDFWFDDKFDLSYWEESFLYCYNTYYIDLVDLSNDPIFAVREASGYTFSNENLLRQSFTRRSFANEHNIKACNEELEFLGDSILNASVTRMIMEQYSEIITYNTASPFNPFYDEGYLSRYRSNYICKEYLSSRMTKLGLDKYILYGLGEQESDSAKEDTLEALIAAIAIDSKWNYEYIDDAIEKLLAFHVDRQNSILKESYYDIFNSWHQRKYGYMPEYEVIKQKDRYQCFIKCAVTLSPYHAGIGNTKSLARDDAAFMAHRYLYRKGEWMDLSEANIVPNLDDSINQLQELFQKKYIAKTPVYEFEKRLDGLWNCTCSASGLFGKGSASNKIKAKKEAAYTLLAQMFKSAGLIEDEWDYISKIHSDK